MDLKLTHNFFKYFKGEIVSQTFTRYKVLLNELTNDGVKLEKHEINVGFVNNLPKKWLSFCQSLRNSIHIRDLDLATLFRKFIYEERTIDRINEVDTNKDLP